MKTHLPYRVHLDQATNVRAFVDHYGCTEELLREAVAAVGDTPQLVREFIAKHAKEVLKRASE
jgi:hypothetical protein